MAQKRNPSTAERSVVQALTGVSGVSTGDQLFFNHLFLIIFIGFVRAGNNCLEPDDESRLLNETNPSTPTHHEIEDP